MQEEKQNIYNTQEMNKNPQVDITSILGDIKGSIFVIIGILVLMFLLQLCLIIFIFLFGMPVFPVWPY